MSDRNCISCVFEDETEICNRCDPNYDLGEENNICKRKVNYISLDFAIIGLIILKISIISFCL